MIGDYSSRFAQVIPCCCKNCLNHCKFYALPLEKVSTVRCFTFGFSQLSVAVSQRLYLRCHICQKSCFALQKVSSTVGCSQCLKSVCALPSLLVSGRSCHVTEGRGNSAPQRSGCSCWQTNLGRLQHCQHQVLDGRGITNLTINQAEPLFLLQSFVHLLYGLSVADTGVVSINLPCHLPEVRFHQLHVQDLHQLNLLFQLHQHVVSPAACSSLAVG